MRLGLLIAGFLVLITVEILRVYFIMPFPGSQNDETIDIAYFLGSNIIYFRLLGLVLIAYPFAYFFNRGSQVIKVTMAVVFGFYILVFYMFNYRFLADQMFLQQKSIMFLDATQTKVLAKQLVLCVTSGTESKAYPIEVIGYHHQVRDDVGGTSIMVTYCTVCRTGRVFLPEVNGKPEAFRLVGMDHFNAMFEDATTKSWWRQVNGEAVAGPLKGKMLNEFPSIQITLAEWISLHPDTKILQPDSVFSEAYEGLKDYDEGKKEGRLERRDSLPWEAKSWIVGIQVRMEARAYDWIDLQKSQTINDFLGGVPLLVVANLDSISFHTFNRLVDGDTLFLSLNESSHALMDTKTNSTWDWSGKCVAGALQGRMLKPLQSYQEYWHSWQTFHPQTTRYTFSNSKF